MMHGSTPQWQSVLIRKLLLRLGLSTGLRGTAAERTHRTSSIGSVTRLQQASRTSPPTFPQNVRPALPFVFFSSAT